MAEFTSDSVVHIGLVILDSFLNITSLQDIWGVFSVSEVFSDQGFTS